MSGHREALREPAGDRAVGSGTGRAPYFTSAALFAPIWPFVGNLPDKAAPASRALVHAADTSLWVGSDARLLGSVVSPFGNRQRSVGARHPASVVGTLPFVTNFNEGEGDTYAVQGREVASLPWNNLSVQDVLPTWSCAVRGNLKAATAYAAKGSGDSFNGGSALRISGAAGEVELFAAMIPVSAGTRPVLAFESKAPKGPLPYVRISYSDGTSDVFAATTNRPGWTQTVGALEAEGKTITAISVAARGNGRDRMAALLGRLRVYDAELGRGAGAHHRRLDGARHHVARGSGAGRRAVERVPRYPELPALPRPRGDEPVPRDAGNVQDRTADRPVCHPARFRNRLGP